LINFLNLNWSLSRILFIPKYFIYNKINSSIESFRPSIYFVGFILSNPFLWSGHSHVCYPQTRFLFWLTWQRLGICAESFFQRTTCPSRAHRPNPWNLIMKNCRIVFSLNKSHLALSPS
jgi:hypothetical protein